MLAEGNCENVANPYPPYKSDYTLINGKLHSMPIRLLKNISNCVADQKIQGAKLCRVIYDLSRL